MNPTFKGTSGLSGKGPGQPQVPLIKPLQQPSGFSSNFVWSLGPFWLTILHPGPPLPTESWGLCFLRRRNRKERRMCFAIQPPLPGFVLFKEKPKGQPGPIPKKPDTPSWTPKQRTPQFSVLLEVRSTSGRAANAGCRQTWPVGDCWTFRPKFGIPSSIEKTEDISWIYAACSNRNSEQF